MSEPTPIDLVVELRKAAGLFDGAMPISPKEAWEEAIAVVKYQRHLAKLAGRLAHEVGDIPLPPPPKRYWTTSDAIHLPDKETTDEG